ncbi:MAG: hypothetical protein IJ188_07435 [Clostridia bacterium]|nr:hypothetical protein [Clostridia bacterium]
MLEQSRAEVIGKFLTDDPERANEILSLTPEEATEKINSFGFDFTVAELEEFGKNLKAAAQNGGEIGEEELENVAGGIAVAAATFYFTVFAGCAVLGGHAANNWKW